MTLGTKCQYPRHPILLVDDEPETLRGFTYLLQSDGLANVVTCRNGREALEYLAFHTAEVVVLDLVMPDIGGQEVLEKAVGDHPLLPVIVLTGLNQVDTAVACMKNGAFDYMVKPVEESRLLSGVRRALELREARREYARFQKQGHGRPPGPSRGVYRHCHGKQVLALYLPICGKPLRQQASRC